MENRLQKKCITCGELMNSVVKYCTNCGTYIENLPCEDTNEVKEDSVVLKELGLKYGSTEEALDKSQNKNYNSDDSGLNGSHSGFNTGSINKGIKALLLVLSILGVGVGQVIAVIIAINFINSDEKVKITFGKKIMLLSVIMFIITIALAFFLALALFEPVK